MKNNSTVRT